MSEHVRLSERTVMVGGATSAGRVAVEVHRRVPHREDLPRSLTMTVGNARMLVSVLALAIADAEAMAAAAVETAARAEEDGS